MCRTAKSSRRSSRTTKAGSKITSLSLERACGLRSGSFSSHVLMKPLLLAPRLAIVFLLLSPATVSLAQTDKPAVSNDEKAQQIIERAIKTVGGDRYLQVKTIIGRGLFTNFADGIPQIPSKFVDYVSYPDRERTEFSGGGARTVQT